MTHSDVDFFEQDSDARFQVVKVLIIDDSHSDIAWIEETLEQSNRHQFECTSVTSLSEGLYQYVRKNYDICLLDNTLADGSAWQFLQTIGNQLRIPIIVVSGYTDVEMEEQLALLGVSDCLNKNYLKSSELYRSIRYALHAQMQRTQLESMAHYDSLTGLVSRSLFIDRMNLALQRVKRKEEDAALIYIDVDRFKSVNDGYGHDVGDLLLSHIASILKSTIRNIDTAARLGGDEFALLLENVTIPEVHKIALKLLYNMRAPVKINNIEVLPSISLGCTHINQCESLSVSKYMMQADRAMYRAKDEGRNTYRFYNQEMLDQYQELIDLSHAFIPALHRQELCLYYQPKHDANTDGVMGFEALVRWPRQGRVLSPALILNVVEHLGMFEELTHWVVEQCCKKLGLLQDSHPNLTMAFNVTSCQLNRALIDRIVSAAERENVPLSRLEVEITESHLMKDPEGAIEILKDLHKLGISVAVDDFGTGFSTLSYLAKLPIDTLKIDKSFVHGLESDAKNLAVSKSIVDLARNLGLKVVAEGVETETQQSALVEIGTDILQGFLFSKPIPFGACSSYLEKYELCRSIQESFPLKANSLVVRSGAFHLI